jgi:Cft2 family RNA processing exonuclease
MPEVTFQSLLQRADIGANCYVLDTGMERIVLDSGMHPKEKGLAALPDFSLLPDGEADAIIVTHAHLDHSGSLPVLMRRQPDAQVIMSELTADLAAAMMHNSCNVMTLQREQEGIKEYPFFTHREVDRIEREWLRLRPGRRMEIGDCGARAEFFEAGHLPGAVGALLDLGGLRVFYTGDVHFEDQTMTMSAQFPEKDVDVLIMECTRGASERAADYSRQAEAQRFARIVTDTVQRGGSVLMPVFAIGKTQEMLLMIHELRRSGHLSPHIPVHIGGLSSRMTQIVDKHSDKARRRHQGFKILESLAGLIRAKKGERDLSSAPGRIYALSSGMMTENTASNDFAFRFIDNPRNSLCLVGYADPDSPAGAILRTEAGGSVKLHSAHTAVPLRSDVHTFDFSGHAPRHQLVEYARKLNPRKILLVHGDSAALEWMAQTLAAALPHSEVIVPMAGEKITL